MAATLFLSPPSVSFSESEIIAGLQTNNVSPSFTTGYILLKNSAGIADGDTLKLVWETNTEIFVFKTTPNAALSLELPLPSGSFNFTYLNLLLDKINSNDRVSRDFNVYGAVAGINLLLEIEAWEPRLFALTVTQTGIDSADITINVENAVSSYLQPNLSGLMTVREVDTNKELLRLVQPYDIDLDAGTAKSRFDIHAAFALKPYIPANLNTGLGFATTAYKGYYLRYADRYGSPPLAEGLIKSPTYYAVWGIDATGFAANTEGYYLFHKPNKAPLTPAQSAWMYFMKGGTGTDTLTVNVTVYFSDHVPFDFQLVATINIEANRLYYLRTDYNYLDIDTACTAVSLDPLKITGYDVTLKAGSTTKAMRQFSLNRQQNCTAVQLAFTNAYGGIETITMHPRTVRRVEAERTTFQIEGSEAEDVLTAEARKIWELKTDLLPTDEAERLAQLILGDVWLINRADNEVTSILADTKTVEIKPVRGMAQLTLIFKSSKIYEAL